MPTSSLSAQRGPSEVQPGRPGNHRETARCVEVVSQKQSHQSPIPNPRRCGPICSARDGSISNIGNPGRNPKCRMQLGSDGSGR